MTTVRLALALVLKRAGTFFGGTLVVRATLRRIPQSAPPPSLIVHHHIPGPERRTWPT
jgi:hypothetical protein